MMRFVWPAAAALLGVIIGFQLVISLVPGFLMSKAITRFEAFGMPVNAAGHPPPIDETARRIVRPSPDILYSVCLYDLAEGPLSIHMPQLAHGALAVVSFYDAQTNNFYRVDNHNYPEGVPVPPLLLTQDHSREGEFVVHAPSETGLVLYRRILSGGVSAEAADATRRGFGCRLAD